MCHSPQPHHPGTLRRAFTIIELVFVMAITSVVFGTALYVISSPKIEKEIREAHAGIEDLVLRARAMAYSYQQPFVVELREGEVRMMPLAQPEGVIESDLPGGAGQPSSLRSLDSMSWPVIYRLDPKYELAVRRWNYDNFLGVRNRVVERWIHEPNSPCEPMAIQLRSVEDQAFLSREYHPLTGKAVDLEMAIGNQ
jgi:type II secretory pathway pseudopilin PulG